MRLLELGLMGNEVICANRTVRRWTFVVIGLIAIVGLWALYFTQTFFRELEALVEYDPVQAISKLLVFLYVSGVVFTAGVMSTSGYLLWLGVRTLRGKRFPPPGTWVIKDTKVIGGGGARWRGYLLAVGGLAVIAAGIAIFIAGSELVATLTEMSEQEQAMLAATTMIRGKRGGTGMVAPVSGSAGD